MASMELTPEELEAAAWAVGHLMADHGFDAISSRSGDSVQLGALRTKLALLAAELKGEADD